MDVYDTFGKEDPGVYWIPHYPLLRMRLDRPPKTEKEIQLENHYEYLSKNAERLL